MSRWENPTLVGELVTLRPYRADDAEAAWEMVRDAETSDLTATTASFTFEQIASWCESRNDQDERLDLVIVDNATGAFAGEVVLNEYDPVGNRVNFRISLRGPAWFGRGLGTEATTLLVCYAFSHLGLATIDLAVLARNTRAIRAYEKAGFQRVGAQLEDGENWVVMAIDRPTEGDSVTID